MLSYFGNFRLLLSFRDIPWFFFKTKFSRVLNLKWIRAFLFQKSNPGNFSRQNFHRFWIWRKPVPFQLSTKQIELFPFWSPIISPIKVLLQNDHTNFIPLWRWRCSLRSPWARQSSPRDFEGLLFEKWTRTDSQLVFQAFTTQNFQQFGTADESLCPSPFS